MDMRHASLFSIVCFLAGLMCLGQQPRAWWQSIQQSGVVAAGGSVTVDATGISNYTAAGTSATFTGLTVGTGNAIVASFAFVASTAVNFPTGITANWDSTGTPQAMTQLAIISAGFWCTSAVYGLKAPTAGNKTLAVNWTNSNELFINVVSYNGVDQTTPFPNQQSGQGVQTIDVTSATGRIVQNTICNRNAITGITGTTIFDDNTHGSNADGAANRDAGAATVTIGDASVGFSLQSLAATDIKAQ